MARQKKDSDYVGIRLEKELSERLSQFCDATRRTKTSVIELALKAYLDAHDADV